MLAKLSTKSKKNVLCGDYNIDRLKYTPVSREFALSDHTAQILACPVRKTYSITHWYKFRRGYSNENVEKFINCLKALTISNCYDKSDSNAAFEESMIYLNFFMIFASQA